MRILRVVLVTLAFSGAPAFAQDSTTRCQTIGNIVNCDTKQQPDIWGAFNRNIQEQNLQRQKMLEQTFEASKRTQASQQDAEAREIWARCRKRWNEALEKRDFELADSLVKGCPAAP